MDYISTWDVEALSVVTKCVSKVGNGSVNTVDVVEVFNNLETSKWCAQSLGQHQAYQGPGQQGFAGNGQPQFQSGYQQPPYIGFVQQPYQGYQMQMLYVDMKRLIT